MSKKSKGWNTGPRIKIDDPDLDVTFSFKFTVDDGGRLGGGLVAGVCIGDLLSFSTTGASLMHPLLAVLLLAASLSLALLGVVATWEITRYTSIWGEQDGC